MDILKDAAAAVDLRLAGLQRRRADHHQAGADRAHQRDLQLVRRHPVRRAAAGAAQQHGVPGVLQRERGQRRLRRGLLRRDRRGRQRERRLAGRRAPLGPGQQLGAGGQRRRPSGSPIGSRATGSTRKASSGPPAIGGSAAGSISTSIPAARSPLRTGLAVTRRPQQPGRGRRERRRHHHQRHRRSPHCPGRGSTGEFSHPGRRAGVSQPGGAAGRSTTSAPAPPTCSATSRPGSGSRRRSSFTSRFGLDLVNLREDQFESRRIVGHLRLERRRRGQERLLRRGPLRDRQLRHPAARPGRPPRARG